MRLLLFPATLLLAIVLLEGFADPLLRAAGLALSPDRRAMLDAASAIALWLASAFLATRLVALALGPALRRKTTRRPLRLIGDIAKGVIWVAALIGIAAFVLDQPVGGFLATSGVLLAILGFALRDVIAGLFSGIALNLESPHQIGDWLGFGDGTTARVEEIGWLTTRLCDRNAVQIVIPNNQLAVSIVRNYGAPGRPWRDNVYLVLDHGSAPRRVARVLKAAMLDVAAVRAKASRHPPDVVLDKVDLEGAHWRLRYWLDDAAEAIQLRDRVQRSALHHLHHAGLPLARPTRRLLGEAGRALQPAASLGEDRQSLALLMARIDLFADLDAAALATLAGAARRCDFEAGSRVIAQDQPGRSLFVVVEGLVDVMIEGAGGEQRIRTLDPGSCFGEYSLLLGEPRSASVDTVCRSVLYEIDRDDLAPLLEQQPQLAERLGRLLEQRRTERRDALQHLPETARPATRPPERSALAAIRALFRLEG